MSNSITRREFLVTTSIVSTGIFLGCSINNRFDLIIKNGTIYDGSGGASFKSDIGIIGDQIKAIGNLESGSADMVIDASNYAVSPGFIDIHTHTETELLINPNAESKIRQGVTTEVGGNCGSSPFPLSQTDFEEMNKSLENKYGLACTWRTINDFFEELERRKTSINFAAFAGHGDLRAFIVGRNDLEPSPDQLKKMKKELAEMMEAGALGMSTGLEYAPGSYAKTPELIELSKTVAEYGGIYNSHMRNEDDRVEEAIKEVIQIATGSGVSAEIAHLKAANANNWHKVGNMLGLIENAEQKGIKLKADRYPYTAYGTGLSTFLPLWSRQGDTSDIIARLNDQNQLPEIREYAESRGARIGGWDRVLISYSSTGKNKKWEGKSIKECSEISNKEPFEFIKDLLIEDRLSAGIVGFAMDEDNTKRILAHPLVMIGSDGSVAAPYGPLSKGKPHPRYYGTFPRVLGKYCREDKIFNLSTAVKKMTSMPAEKLGIRGRGYIKKNYFADVVIFDPKTVRDKATFADPHQYPEGIDYVIVNGKLTIKKGEHLNIRAGSVIRKA